MTLLERWRLEGGMSRAELAAAAGVSPETIRLVERGERRLHVGTAVRIGVPLGRTALEILAAAQTVIEGESA